ncbi:MAG: hypothetical protein ACK4UU_01790 [Fimbriimonadales bacterium]
MRGIDYVVDEHGKKKAVLIDLTEWGELWEDFYDILISESRKHEPTIPWEQIKAEIEREEERSA